MGQQLTMKIQLLKQIIDKQLEQKGKEYESLKDMFISESGQNDERIS